MSSSSSEDETNQQQNNVAIIVGSFVLVQITTTRKDKKYFIAEVNEVHDDHYKISYLKKLQDSFKFIRADDTSCDGVIPHEFNQK